MYQSNYYLIPKPIQTLNPYDRWRKRAQITGLSVNARMRLEWIIFYRTAGGHNATHTAKHFGISRSKFYFWHTRFNELNLKSLEDKPSIPKVKRTWKPDPRTLTRMIRLKKKYIHWSKLKLSVVYERLYGERISSWQFQRVIMEFRLYPKRKKKDNRKKNGAKRQIISYEIRRNTRNLYCLDTKVLWLFGIKYYILVAIAHTEKVAYARVYTSHSSKVAADFLTRLEYLLGRNIEVILTDNGTEFAKYFDKACQNHGITRYYSRVRTPKDNPVV